MRLKLSFWLILIALALLLSAASESAEKSTAPTELKPPVTENYKSSAKHQQNMGNQPIGKKPEQTSGLPIPDIVKQSPTAPTEKTPAAKEPHTEQERWWPPSSGWAIVYITAVYVLVSIGQLCSIRRQAEIAADGVPAYRIAAAAAQKSADIADKSLKLLERARLVVMFDYPFQPVPNTLTEVAYSVINAGNTLAKLKKVEIRSTVWESLPDDLKIEPMPTDDFPDIAIIYPSTPLELRGNISVPLSEETIRRIYNREIILALRGFVVYDDIFDIRHITRFCQIYDPSRNNGRGGFIFPREAKPGYNEAT